MVGQDNRVLEQLSATGGEMGRLTNEMQTMQIEMTAMRQQLADHLKRLEAN
jgi:hypothetical protein